MTDCQVCSRKQEQHYIAVTKKLIQAGIIVGAGAGAGTLFCNEGMITHDKLTWRNHSLARNYYILGVITMLGACLGSVLGETAGTIYIGADMICANLSKRKCTCLPAQPS